MAIKMSDRDEVIQPEVYALVELGRGVGGIRISATDRATTRQNLHNAWMNAKERSQRLETPKP
jgi:hypothetical protein